jgi:micrococcal nuclease
MKFRSFINNPVILVTILFLFFQLLIAYPNNKKQLVNVYNSNDLIYTSPELKNETNPQDITGFPVKTDIPITTIEITEPSQNQNEDEIYQVIRVIDGDTIELADGRKLRYIGIDAPETNDPRKSIQCFGREAYEKNRQLVENQYIRLEKDISEVDKYGRLLRFVYIDNIFINDYLVREGFAYASTYPPDVKYQNILIEAQREAQEFKRGLWNACQNVQGINITQTNSQEQNTLNNFICNCQKSCSQITSCDEALFQLNNCGCIARDGDHDGIACDGKPLFCEKNL